MMWVVPGCVTLMLCIFWKDKVIEKHQLDLVISLCLIVFVRSSPIHITRRSNGPNETWSTSIWATSNTCRRKWSTTSMINDNASLWSLKINDQWWTTASYDQDQFQIIPTKCQHRQQGMTTVTWDNMIHYIGSHSNMRQHDPLHSSHSNIN